MRTVVGYVNQMDVDLANPNAVRQALASPWPQVMDEQDRMQVGLICPLCGATCDTAPGLWPTPKDLHEKHHMVLAFTLQILSGSGS